MPQDDVIQMLLRPILIHFRNTLFACVLLSRTVDAVLQEAPQRVERIQEESYCEDEHSYYKSVNTYLLVEGSTTKLSPSFERTETTEKWKARPSE